MASVRARELMILGGGAGGVLLLLMILAFTGLAKPAADAVEPAADSTQLSEPITFTKVIGADPGALPEAQRPTGAPPGVGTTLHRTARA